jgi:hypothetical protein
MLPWLEAAYFIAKSNIPFSENLEHFLLIWSNLAG